MEVTGEMSQKNASSPLENLLPRIILIKELEMPRWIAQNELQIGDIVHLAQAPAVDVYYLNATVVRIETDLVITQRPYISSHDPTFACAVEDVVLYRSDRLIFLVYRP